MIEKVLKTLTVDNRDVRKGDWTNKEVRITNRDTFIFPFFDEKELCARITQLIEAGVTPHIPMK